MTALAPRRPPRAICGFKGATFSYSGATVGLLEVYYRNPNGVGSWQPVCDDGFDATDGFRARCGTAAVVSRRRFVRVRRSAELRCTAETN